MHYGTILAVIGVSMVAYGADFPYNSGAPADAFQVGIASNLNVGDSVINMTNAGINGVGNPTLSNSICVNTYVFDPSATLLECCSFRLVANSLANYSVRSDLVSNISGPVTPNAVVVKLVATDPVNNTTCNAGATGTLAGGLTVEGTSLHALPTTPVSYNVTNSPYQNKVLGFGEYQKLTSQCSLLQQTGGGRGICRIGGGF